MRKLLALLILPLGIFAQTPKAFTSTLSFGTGTSLATQTLTAVTVPSVFAPTFPTNSASSGLGWVSSAGAWNYDGWASTGVDYYYYSIGAPSNMNITINTINSNIRSSNTGPRFMNLETATAIAGPWTSRAAVTLTNANNTDMNATGLSIVINAGTTLFIRFINSNSTVSANGGTLAAGGTSRINSTSIVGTYECAIQPTVGNSASMTLQCEDSFAYYGPNSTTFHFAINKTGNTMVANVTTVDAGAVISKTSTNGSNQEHAMYLMRRYWDASLTSGSIGTPVSVRFYYTPADATAAMTARDAAFTALPGTTLARTNGASGEWFKTPNGTAFDAGYISTIVGNKFPAGVLKPTTVTGTQNSVNYVQYNGLTGFSGGTIGFSFGPNTGGGANGLPVTWAGFDASVQRDYTELIWHTASEQNTSHFEVEASEDGKTFKKISENIAAAGNSASLLTYSFRDMDMAPVKYYRLKQVDIEGEFEYSKIIVAKRSEGEKQDFDLVVYPVSENNNKEYHLLLKNKTEDISAIQIVDYTGKPVFKATSSKNTELLDLNILTPGIYMIQVWNGEEKQVERVVVR